MKKILTVLFLTSVIINISIRAKKLTKTEINNIKKQPVEIFYDDDEKYKKELYDPQEDKYSYTKKYLMAKLLIGKDRLDNELFIKIVKNLNTGKFYAQVHSDLWHRRAPSLIDPKKPSVAIMGGIDMLYEEYNQFLPKLINLLDQFTNETKSMHWEVGPSGRVRGSLIKVHIKK